MMLRIKDSLLVLVLVFFGLWLAFGKTQHHMLWHNFHPLLLEHSKDSRTYSPGFWVEKLSGLGRMPWLSQAAV